MFFTTIHCGVFEEVLSVREPRVTFVSCVFCGVLQCTFHYGRCVLQVCVTDLKKIWG